MNREIKFRAWNKERETRLDTEWIGNYDDLYFCDLSDIINNIQECNIVVMQRTGLNDSKGNPIYEGDVIINDVAQGIGNIIREKDSSRFARDREGRGDYIHGLELEDCDKYEVIGNIWENPELLSTP